MPARQRCLEQRETGMAIFPRALRLLTTLSFGVLVEQSNLAICAHHLHMRMSTCDSMTGFLFSVTIDFQLLTSGRQDWFASESRLATSPCRARCSIETLSSFGV
ncbi:hypothetical protein BJY01DRAFT_202785 [Aspergillus pseudoustus]|uniref:Secreted protein n=1 Tax=Aspergillus pseudoustus TaxID=1810923 RepID=A0ABR4KXU6_9EURO